MGMANMTHLIMKTAMPVFPHPIPLPLAGNPHPIPPPEGEGSIALSPSGGKMDRGLGANESLREFHVKRHV
jgi:hypothetical protein